MNEILKIGDYVVSCLTPLRGSSRVIAPPFAHTLFIVAHHLSAANGTKREEKETRDREDPIDVVLDRISMDDS